VVWRGERVDDRPFQRSAAQRYRWSSPVEPFHCRPSVDNEVWPKGVCPSSAWSLRIHWRRDGRAVIAPLLLYYYTATVLNSHYPITVIAVFEHCAPSAADCNTTGWSHVGAKTIETHVSIEGVGHWEQRGRRNRRPQKLGILRLLMSYKRLCTTHKHFSSVAFDTATVSCILINLFI